MKKQIIITIIIILVIAAGIGIFFVLQKPQVDKCDLNKDGKVSALEQQKCEQQPGNGGAGEKGKCGDGICDAKEKANPELCPKDCGNITSPPTSSEFISGFKLDNFNGVKGISEAAFGLADEAGVDYMLVPVKYPERASTGDVSSIDWSSGLDYYYIFELSEKYDVGVMPAFYKLGGKDDKDAEKYADFVVSFLDEFYKNGNIKYIEFQNEPAKDYDGTISARFKGSAEELAKTNTAAYEAVKKKYPGIKIGTAGFMASAVTVSENKMLNQYYDEYFSAKPKFDFISLHHYPKAGSFTQGIESSAGKYTFLSEYEIFATYRKLLDDYGYSSKALFPTEGCVDMPFAGSAGEWIADEEAAILLAERAVLDMANSEGKNIIGFMISCTEGATNNNLFDYLEQTGSFETTSAFDFYKRLLGFMEKYPVYSKHVAGEVNSENYWVEEFKNADGKKMWIAFCPFLFNTDIKKETPKAEAIEKSITCPQEASFGVSSIKSVKITNGISGQTQSKNIEDGKISFTLNKEPVFVEEQ